MKCEAEADWLREAGFEDIVHSLEGDTQSTAASIDDLLLSSLAIPLTDRQTKTIKKKFQTLRTTLLKQKGNKKGQEVVQFVNSNKQRPDVRSIFYTDETPTPDSKSETTVKDGNVLRTQISALEVPNNIPLSRTSSSPNLSKMSRERTSSESKDYGKFKVIRDDASHKLNKSNEYLSANSQALIVKKESRFSWSGYKRAFKVSDSHSNRRASQSSLALESNDSGIEMLSLKYKSSLRNEGNYSITQQNEKNIQQISDVQVSDYFNCDHITPEGLGITFEIKSDTHPFSPIITDVRLSSAYVLRLEDLTADMHKKIKSLALIELTTVLDMYDLEYEKVKRRRIWKRIKKNSENSFFGIPLIDLINMDRKRDTNYNIPFILKILLDYIRINGLHEEGIFRITGSQQRVQCLKEELEGINHLRDNSEELIDTFKKYSAYDVCGVFKLFIRELPDPLLTYELLEAFLLVPKITDQIQQIQILNLLILLLNDAHRHSLEAILSLLHEIILHEHLNKMSAHNIATVMAPNLFPNLVNKKITKGGEHKEMTVMLERAKDSLIVSKLLINSQFVLFQVPPYLIAQIQRKK